MDNLRSTVIMKTDLASFTDRVAQSSPADIADILNIHKELVSMVVAKNSGSIIKGEGDSFWIIFPSVRIAAVSAVEIQQELQIAQVGVPDEGRLHVRIAISLVPGPSPVYSKHIPKSSR